MSANPSTEVAVRDVGALDRVEEIRKSLANTEDVEEIREIRDLAEAAEVFARAKKESEAYLIAGEVKLWAERRAGELRRHALRGYSGKRRLDREEGRILQEQGLSPREIADRLGVSSKTISRVASEGWKESIPPITDFDARMGQSSKVARFWQQLAEIPEERFKQLVSEAQEKDLAFNAMSFLRRDGRAYVSRVEPGIYALRDGCLVIRWRKNGTAHRKKLQTSDISEARRALALARGTISDKQVRGAKTTADVYALVRRALQVLDNVRPSLEPEARKLVGTAITHLHHAEDALVQASNTFPARKGAA